MNSTTVSDLVAVIMGMVFAGVVCAGLFFTIYTPDKLICDGIASKYQVETAMSGGECYVQNGNILQPIDELFIFPR